MELIVSVWIADWLALSPNCLSGVYNLTISTSFSVGRFKNTLNVLFLALFLCRSSDYSHFFCQSNRFNHYLSQRSRYACGLQALFHHLCPYFQYYILWQFEVFTGYPVWDFCFLVLHVVQFFHDFSPREKPAVVIHGEMVRIISLLWCFEKGLASPLLPSTVIHNGRLYRIQHRLCHSVSVN
jgi:hypothetical protein